MSVTQHDRSYLERTIETVRNHRDADNCWPSWANIFADEIERLWAIEAAAKALVEHGKHEEIPLSSASAMRWADLERSL